MKIKYNQLEDRLYVNSKVVRKTNKKFMTYACEYAIQQVSIGNSLADLFPLESEEMPLPASIFNYIEMDSNLSEKLSKAEQGRLAVVREKMLDVADKYRKNPSDTNKDMLVALEKVYASLRKASEETGTVIIKYHSLLPQDFWADRKVVTPENPRDLKNKGE